MLKPWPIMLLAAAASGLSGQGVEEGDARRVMAAPAWGALVEPHLTAHPTEPGWLLGGVMVRDTASPSSQKNHCLSLLSTDGGRTWESQKMPFADCADPWLAITGSGRAVYLALGMHDAVGWPGAMGLLLARSPDGGRTWSDTLTSLGREQDRPTMVADPRTGEPHGIVVFSGQGVRLDDRPVRWSVFVARSVNAGRSFRLPVHLFPSNLNLNSAEGLMLADGTILASFVDFMRNVDDFRSREGMLQRRRIWMLRSADEGRTFSPPLFATEDCRGRSSYDVAADLSEGPHSGRIYLACPAYEGNGIYLHHSDDQGETWTSPRPVRGSGDGERTAVQPRLAVNGAGAVAISWIESDGPASATCNQTFVSASVDGGTTFGDPTPLAPRSCPDPARNGFAYRRWRHGGDYYGLTAAADDRFHALWSDARRGAFDLMTAAFAVRP